jgi:diaminohydroxyphosphoribosylaminopyrimidine deaminase / 5-amino-6-(5-phosphoribosylamino)uracil reductase
MSTDTIHMARALAVAERGRGSTSPNPMVGAVVVDDEGIVVGCGAHAVAGGPHAEILAFADAGSRSRGATLYCTLEPCSHTGRTGPCAPAVVRAGIRRAVIALEDPNPLVAGQGLEYLRDHHIDVSVGVMREAAERQNGPFLTVMRQRRPFVTMKVALSRENCVAGAGGHRLALTGPSANRYIHRDRAEVDAIAVGSGTIVADDPLLTARGAYRRRPLTRVVFDRRLRLPAGSRLLSSLADGPIIVIATEPGASDLHGRAQRLREAGARVEFVAESEPGTFLRASLTLLAGLGVSSLMLEGGPSLHHAAWSAGLVDKVQMFMTPTVAGAAGVPWLDRSRVEVDDLHDVRTLRLGKDLMVEGYVHRAG